MEAVEVKEVTRADAAATMRQAGLRAPLDIHGPDTIAAHGECFQLRTGAGVGVFVLRREGAVLWIDGAGARVRSMGLTADGLAVIENIARLCGCTTVAFETVRRGLVRKAEGAGYGVAGYIMKKEL